MAREQENEYEGAYRIRLTIGNGGPHDREKFLGPWATLQGAKNMARKYEGDYYTPVIEKISGAWEEVK